MGTVHEHQYTVLIISCSILLEMRNISDKSYRENQYTHFIFNNFFSKIVSLSMWKNTVVSDSATDDNMVHVSYQILSVSLFILIPLTMCP
jgi:tetrahydromethanopterin S-methyltransferase subunit E